MSTLNILCLLGRKTNSVWLKRLMFVSPARPLQPVPLSKFSMHIHWVLLMKCYKLFNSWVLFVCVCSSQMSKCGKNKRSWTGQACVFLVFLPHFDILCNLILNRCMATRIYLLSIIKNQTNVNDFIYFHLFHFFSIFF